MEFWTWIMLCIVLKMSFNGAVRIIEARRGGRTPC